MTEPERAYLVGVRFPKENRSSTLDSLAELKRLAQSAGALAVGESFQEIKEINPASLIGKGKAEEIRALSQGADMVIFDAELSPVQQRNLENILNKKVLDRTGLILDIFAQRARTKEGQIQVELAQLKYLQTRLIGHGVALSRLGGGIGTRGPGETKLEMDRRRIKHRITKLNKELEAVRAMRRLHRSRRQSIPIPQVSLVGYTNAGKSTLMNYLTDSHVIVEDKLFATLDPTIKRLELPDGQRILISDTVGFIRRLPHALVEAFRATFEEVHESDLLIHVIDFSSNDWETQALTVDKVLREMKIEKPVIRAFNKVDAVDPAGILYPQGAHPKNDSGDVYISAVTGLGIDRLLWLISQRLKENMRRVKIVLPISAGEIIHEVYEKGWVLQRKDEADGVILEANIEKALAEKLSKMGYLQ